MCQMLSPSPMITGLAAIISAHALISWLAAIFNMRALMNWQVLMPIYLPLMVRGKWHLSAMISMKIMFKIINSLWMRVILARFCAMMWQSQQMLVLKALSLMWFLWAYLTARLRRISPLPMQMARLPMRLPLLMRQIAPISLRSPRMAICQSNQARRWHKALIICVSQPQMRPITAIIMMLKCVLCQMLSCHNLPCKVTMRLIYSMALMCYLSLMAMGLGCVILMRVLKVKKPQITACQAVMPTASPSQIQVCWLIMVILPPLMRR